MATRKEVADALKNSVGYLFFRYRFSCSFELGVLPWGRRRADVVASKISGQLVIVEVKSCVQDFRTDSKWTEYLGHCDRLYLAFTASTWTRIKKNDELMARIPKAVGVITLGTTGYARIVRPARNAAMDPDVRLNMLARLAWRNGDLNKRNTRARQRVYLPD